MTRIGLCACAVFVAVGISVLPSQVDARDQLRIVGSSTVFPFSTAVAEQFGKTSSYKTPIVEATGSGGGFNLFCKGVGLGTPDIVNASRPIKRSEIGACCEAGISALTEVKFGFDGIVIANAKQAPAFQLTKRILFLALAKYVPSPDGAEKLVPNPYRLWSDIDPQLPSFNIEVLGPPPTSGTRDVLQEVVLRDGAATFDWIHLSTNDQIHQKTQTMREDGLFIDAGENDNLIVQKITDNEMRLGIFGFSFLEENLDLVKGNAVEGTVPTFDSIADGDYSLARSLFFYVKDAHRDLTPGLNEFVAEFSQESTWGWDGYLADKGLIPLPDPDRRPPMQGTHSCANLAAF